jgi:hypothetical protein
MLYEIICEALLPFIVLGIVYVVSKTTTPPEDITFTEIDNQLKGK